VYSPLAPSLCLHVYLYYYSTSGIDISTLDLKGDGTLIQWSNSNSCNQHYASKKLLM